MTLKKRSLWIILGVVGALVIVLLSLVQFYVDYMWFSEVAYTEVFLKELLTKIQLGIPVFFVLLAGMIIFSSQLVKRINPEDHIPFKNRSKHNKWLYALLVLGISLLASLFVVNQIWYLFLEFINQTNFGLSDPIFNQDIAFYFFTKPFFEMIYVIIRSLYLGAALIIIAYYAYQTIFKNKINLFEGDQKFSDLRENSGRYLKDYAKDNLKLIGILVGTFLILLTPQYLFEAYDYLYSTSGIVFGPGTADIDVGLKIVILKAGLALIFGIIAIVGGLKKNFKLILSGPIILLLVTGLGAAGQGIYESLVVVPNQFVKEEKYIANNIKFTQTAYDLLDVEVVDFSGSQELTAQDIEENEITINNIPINDQAPTKDMYNSLQGIRNYYQFYDIDVDRYTIDGDYTQVFLGGREINNDLLPDQAKTWVNEHLKYTHGFGVAMSPVNETNASGQPELIIKDIPPKSEYAEIEIDQPRIYFGESDYDYIITNCTTPEFDYPEGDDNQEIFYSGTAGIPMTFLNRLAFAIYHGSVELLLANEITPDSQMIIHRNVAQRIKKIAPFLSYDSDPYLTIADGKLYWIIDAFTTSDRYPYSTPFNDSGYNYIRNSVKLVVDAYNGDVTFYQVEDDPVLETYGKIYPDLLKDISQMPSEIRDHIRYSKTLFDIQADIYKTYHMSNPQVFYNKEDQWEAASQYAESEKTEVSLASSYIIMKLPQRQEEFMLTATFTPKDKDNMNAWLAGVSDGEEYGKLILYQFPKQQLVYGPMQIEQRIDQDTTISPQLTLLGQQGSRVLRGNLMTIPIEDGILYVEPVYIQAASGDNNLPEVKKVILSYGNQLIMADSLRGGIEELFGLAKDEADGQSTTDSSLMVADTFINQANTLFEEAQAAQRAGDWTLYGQKISELESILKQMQESVS